MSTHYDLNRFVEAQANLYEIALAELQAGHKASHWMWFMFPQVDGLGHSQMAKRFAIGSIDEARSYIEHELLGSRLRELTTAVLAHTLRSAEQIFGSIDALKFRSCMTLFDAIVPNDVFAQVLVQFYGGEPDPQTQAWLAVQESD